EGYRLIIKDVTQFNEKEIIGKLGWRSDQIYHFVDLLKLHQKHTIFNIGFGVQKDFYGGKIVQLIALIQILLGNIGNPGTGIIYSQSDFCKKTLKPLVEYITNIRSTDSLPEVSLINLSKALRSDKYKMVFIYNFNPLSSLPNHNMVRRSFLRKDLFVVVQDVFLNETSKYADIVIPSKFDLETHDIISPYYFPSISINEAGPCPYPDCLSNFEFYKKLANKMNWGNESLFIEDDKSIVDNCLKLLPLDYKRNILIKGYHALFEVSDTPFNDLLFPTKSRKINLSELNIDFGFQRLKMVEDRKKNEFFLITPSHKYYIHSQLGRINKGVLSDFKNIYISKEDMKTHDLKEGMMVLVQNEYGKGKFILAKSSFLVKGIAMIYSGSPMANFFTPDIPEELGESGAYNSAIIEIRVLKRN
ncbi:MAG: molybdopterin-dependent oxidoreductase, partial [Candidatus Thorarchaeota archaeon]